MLPSTLPFLVLSLLFFHPTTIHSTAMHHAAIATPTAVLDYGTFIGSYSSTYNLSYFQRIPFGASTAGKNRFRAPQPPAPISAPYHSSGEFSMCPQRETNGSEDCLYLGVYSRPWQSPQRLRPVLVTFYGGGFIRGSASFSIPPSGFPVLNASTLNDYVVVYSNYRTNVFGFLPGRKVQQHPEADLNPGLLDQQAALKWVSKYIQEFGGDSQNVTIWGQSAGGGSVVAQTIATGNRGKKLFTKALASSPYWPKTYRYDDPEAEDTYDALVQLNFCKGEADEIACLKGLDVQVLRTAALAIADRNKYTTSSYTWAPVLDDGEFLGESLTAVTKRGNLNAEMVLASYNLHEGENFIPTDFQRATTGSEGFNSSEESLAVWLDGFLPRLSTTQRRAVLTKVYPPNGTVEEFKYTSAYERAGLIYRDVVLACPAYWLAEGASEGEKGYLMEYTIAPAKHASDTKYWNTIDSAQTSDPLTYTGYTGAMASFIQTGDPNTHKLTTSRSPSVPHLSDQKQFVVSQGKLAVGSVDMLKRRCDFWRSLGDVVPV